MLFCCCFWKIFAVVVCSLLFFRTFHGAQIFTTAPSTTDRHQPGMAEKTGLSNYRWMGLTKPIKFSSPNREDSTWSTKREKEIEVGFAFAGVEQISNYHERLNQRCSWSLWKKDNPGASGVLELTELKKDTTGTGTTFVGQQIKSMEFPPGARGTTFVESHQEKSRIGRDSLVNERTALG